MLPEVVALSASRAQSVESSVLIGTAEMFFCIDAIAGPGNSARVGDTHCESSGIGENETAYAWGVRLSNVMTGAENRGCFSACIDLRLSVSFSRAIRDAPSRAILEKECNFPGAEKECR